MNRGIAKRDGRPAYIGAPPRLRQSDIPRPFPLIGIEEPGLFARLCALLKRGRT